MTPSPDLAAPLGARTPRETLGLMAIAVLALWPLQYLLGKAAPIVLYKAGLYRPEAWRELNFGDIDAFIVAGQLMRAGRAACLYTLDCVGEAQAAYSGLDAIASRMTWNYPPTMDLAVLPLAWLPPTVAYAGFLALNLALLGLVAHRLRPGRTAPPAADRDPLLDLAIRALPVILVVTAPGVITGLAIGQNGVLLASIAALGLSLVMDRPFRAGLVLGLLIVKPHLAVLLPFVVLGQPSLRRAMHLVAGAALSVGVFTAASLVAFGPEPWTLFFEGLGQTRALFIGGGYPRSQITSLYVSLVALQVPEPIALAGQVAAGLGVGALLVLVWRRIADPTTRVALTLMALPLASPYAYYYDLAPWILGLALLVRQSLRRSGPGREVWALVAFIAVPWAGILLNNHVPPSSTPNWLIQPVGILLIEGFVVLTLRMRGVRRA